MLMYCNDGHTLKPLEEWTKEWHFACLISQPRFNNREAWTPSNEDYDRKNTRAHWEGSEQPTQSF